MKDAAQMRVVLHHSDGLHPLLTHNLQSLVRSGSKIFDLLLPGAFPLKDQENFSLAWPQIGGKPVGGAQLQKSSRGLMEFCAPAGVNQDLTRKCTCRPST